jgi:hypothetical protein
VTPDRNDRNVIYMTLKKISPGYSAKFGRDYTTGILGKKIKKGATGKV